MVHGEVSNGLRMKAYRIFSQRNPQVVEDQSRVLPSTTQDHVDSVPIGSFERAAMQESVDFHVSHDRFDSVASFELTLDPASHTALLPAFENLNIGNVVTTIAEIHITTLGTLSR